MGDLIVRWTWLSDKAKVKLQHLRKSKINIYTLINFYLEQLEIME